MIAARFAAELLAGPTQRGRGLGHGYVLVGDDVLALTPPGAPRLPNGIETDVSVALGEEVVVGAGALRTPAGYVRPSLRWDARPSPHVLVALDLLVAIDAPTLVGWGPGLTPLGDDILVGYVAGRVLAGRRPPPLVSAGTTALSRTLLACAARGELPEPAHALLEDGDAAPLLAWGATSGKGLLLGLGAASGAVARAAFHLELPLPGGTRTIGVSLERIANPGPGPVRGPAPLFEPPLYGSCSSAGPRS